MFPESNFLKEPNTPNCRNIIQLWGGGMYCVVKRLYFDFAFDFGFFFLRQILSFFTNAQSLGL